MFTFSHTCLRQGAVGVAAASALLLSGCVTPGGGQPGSASPVSGGSTSNRVNQLADNAAYQAVTYRNATKKGPMVVILPGQIKSGSATFGQMVGPNNIADFAELEMGRANFPVLERSGLGSLTKEMELAYNLGDPKAAARVFQKGSLKTTRFVLRFDILKAEKVASASQGFDGSAIGPGARPRPQRPGPSSSGDRISSTRSATRSRSQRETPDRFSVALRPRTTNIVVVLACAFVPVGGDHA